jgi:AmmeMemoRadiSam system protein B
MKNNKKHKDTPFARNDLEFIPVQQGDQKFVLIKDHLGLVREGMGIALHLYQFMTLLDGTKTIRDLQAELMRQRGGILVDVQQVEDTLTKLDDAFLLDSDKFKRTRDKINADFISSKIRRCILDGRSYPKDPSALKKVLDNILAVRPSVPQPEGKIIALIAPHIDLAVGRHTYSSAYQTLKHAAPSRVILLGIGHQMSGDLFCLTEKDFETPLGVVKNEPLLIRALLESGKGVVADTDLDHRSEHSLEFQIIFLQHLLGTENFTVIPILCGSFYETLTAYTRKSYLDKTAHFLNKLKEVAMAADKETLLVAGVDLSHIGPKFGHQMPAHYLESRAITHDQNLLNCLYRMEADNFWEESTKAEDQFNVCGFPAMAALIEILPPCKGRIIDYQFHHENQTQSAVSFAAVVFSDF